MDLTQVTTQQCLFSGRCKVAVTISQLLNQTHRLIHSQLQLQDLHSLIAGTIKVKLSGTYVYTAGGQIAVNGASTAIEELGPLDETERGSQVYEVDFTIGGTACSCASK